MTNCKSIATIVLAVLAGLTACTTVPNPTFELVWGHENGLVFFKQDTFDRIASTTEHGANLVIVAITGNKEGGTMEFYLNSLSFCLNRTISRIPYREFSQKRACGAAAYRPKFN